MKNKMKNLLSKLGIGITLSSLVFAFSGCGGKVYFPAGSCPNIELIRKDYIESKRKTYLYNESIPVSFSLLVYEF